MRDPLWSEVRRTTQGEVRAGRVVAPAIVIGRAKDGTVRVRFPDGACSVRAGRLQQGVGNAALVSPTTSAIRTEPSTAGPGLVESTSMAPPVLWVESIAPDVLEQGFAGTVTALGLGFEVGVTAFAFLVELAGGELAAHPGITLNSTTVLDSETAELDVVVAADADLVDEAPLGYSNTGGLPT